MGPDVKKRGVEEELLSQNVKAIIKVMSMMMSMGMEIMKKIKMKI